MTTGNVTYSVFDVVPRVPSGTCNVGLFSTKVWNGTDRAKVEYVRSPQRYIFRELSSDWYSRRDGRPLTLTRLYRFKIGRERAGGLSKPPRRAEVDHPYSATINRWSDEKVTYFAGQTFQDAVVATFGASTWAPVSLLNANDQFRLIGKLREKLLGSDFDCSVFLGEMGQTVRLIADSAIRIRQALSNLRRGNIVDATKWLLAGTSRYGRREETISRLVSPKVTRASLSAKWLEIQYGWRPLLSDAGEAAQFLAQRLSVPFAQIVRSSVRREQSNTKTTNLGPGDNVLGKAVQVHGRSIKAIITESPNLAASLGLLNPENVMWELTPWSFVVDWFIPIGQYLESRAFAQHLVGQFWTTDYLSGTRLTPVGKQFSARASWRQIQVSRAFSSALDVPMPAFKPLSKVASWEHCANAIALLGARSKPHIGNEASAPSVRPGKPPNWDALPGEHDR